MFKGILIEKDEAGYRATLTDLDEGRLPEGDVTVRVSHSTLNYKDALAITGKGPVVRTFPMVPGIDLAGTVERSTHPDYAAGDAVILNGWGVGETHWGGLAQKARLNGNWLVPLPAQFTPVILRVCRLRRGCADPRQRQIFGQPFQRFTGHRETAARSARLPLVRSRC